MHLVIPTESHSLSPERSMHIQKKLRKQSCDVIPLYLDTLGTVIETRIMAWRTDGDQDRWPEIDTKLGP